MLVIMGAIIDNIYVPHLRFFFFGMFASKKYASSHWACLSKIKVPICNSNSNSTEKVMICG